jgi:HEAT repeat protein
MKRLARNRNTTRSFQRLVRIALRRWDTDEGWRAIAELQMRGSPQMLAAATAFTRSPNWRRRSLGVYIASQLRQRRSRASSAYAVEETQDVLLAGLHDGHDEVVRAAVSGLGHRPHPAAVDDLIKLSSHRDGRLRWNVAVSLGMYHEPSAVEALLHLTADPDDAVRDWATFGLGSLQPADTPEIRAELWKNLHDTDDDVRGEALVGLAQRHDERVVEYLLKGLGPDCRVYELDAAEKLADPNTLSALQALAGTVPEQDRRGYWFSRLQGAIDACSARRQDA